MARAAGSQQATTRSVSSGHNWPSIGLAMLLTAAGAYLLLSVLIGGKGEAVAQTLPGKTHIHTALLYPQAGVDKLLVGAHDGLYERSSKPDEAGWRQSNALPATDIMGFAYQPQQPNRLYAVGHSFGVVVSDDGGANWNNRLPGMGSLDNRHDVHALAVDPLVGSVFVWVEQKGLLRSTDQGASWQVVNPTVGGQVMALWIERVGERQVIYAGTMAGLLRSADGGANWVNLGGSELSGGVYALAGDGKDLYVGTLGGLYQSSDQGHSWRAVAGLPQRAAVGVVVNLRSPNQRVAILSDASVYFSSDAGASWQAAK